MSIAIALFATLCAGVVFARCVCVLDHLDYRGNRGNEGNSGSISKYRDYLLFLTFGLSYCLLATVSVYAMFRAWDGQASPVDYGFLIASAGLILFDRRKPRHSREKKELVIHA